MACGGPAVPTAGPAYELRVDAGRFHQVVVASPRLVVDDLGGACDGGGEPPGDAEPGEVDQLLAIRMPDPRSIW
ncbi:MAG: hypothetical protein ACRDZO_08770 [Egibacteraceae bacterium]